VLLALLGCEPDGLQLVVRLQSDLCPGVVCDSVRVSLQEAPNGSLVGMQRVVTVDGTRDWLNGSQLTIFDGLPAGPYRVLVELLDAAGSARASRVLDFDLRASTAVTARLNSACLGVECPAAGDAPEATQCVSGRCVPPMCSPETPESCGEAACTRDEDCAAGVDCVTMVCLDGECFGRRDDTRCAAGEYCDPATGCRPEPSTVPDAGPRTDGGVDAGVDAGSSCPPCDDGDPCTLDVCDAGTCTFPPRCAAGQYCEAGICHPQPTFSLETVEAGGCIDLGVPHASGSDFAYRRTITGRPGFTARQYNDHVSCPGDPIVPGMEFPLDGAGRHTDTFYSGALDECWDGIYGRWRSHVVVDGRTSNVEEVVYYNSRCPNVATCTAARSFCSPCRDCDLSRGYCWLGTTCAPDPELTIETASGPGCVDLAFTHVSPPATRTIITGRPNATTTQINEHVSCAGSTPRTGEERTLDATGRVQDELQTGAVSNCVSANYGTWRVFVEDDAGARSNAVEVVYYNSSCPGLQTCAAAADACFE
jgi:hypothetical protein